MNIFETVFPVSLIAAGIVVGMIATSLLSRLFLRIEHKTKKEDY